MPCQQQAGKVNNEKLKMSFKELLQTIDYRNKITWL